MEHYYSSSPSTRHDEGLIHFEIKENKLNFITDAGVFSKSKIDFGSELLISSVEPTAGKILDIGCGYGPIGISLCKLNPNAQITMIDVNQRAADLAKRNIVENGIKNATVLLSDGFTNVTDTFDVIVSNPPIRTGKKVLYPIYENSIHFLNPSGTIYLVVQKKQGANSTIDKLESIYGNCEVINKSGGYWILRSIKK